MKKLSVLIFVLLSCLFSNRLQAQYLLANIELNNCPSCYAGLFHLSKLNLPKFMILAERYREDSLEVERVHHFGRLGFQLIFDDSLFAATKVPKVSSLHIYNADLEKVAVKDLQKLTKEFIADSLSILRIESPSFEQSILTAYRPTFYCKFDMSLGSLKVYDRRSDSLKYQVRSSEFPYEDLVPKLPAEKQEKMNSMNIEINRNTAGIGGGYSGFALDEEDNIYLLFDYSLIRDSVVDGSTKYFATTEYCMVKVDQRGEIAALYPIEMNPEYHVTDRTFHVLQDTVWFTTHDYRDWFRHKAARNESWDLECIAKYAVQDGRFVFVQPVPYPLPFIYASKYYENGMNAFPSIFPFYNLFLSNEIYHLETGKIAHIVDDDSFRSKVRLLPAGDLINLEDQVLRVSDSYVTAEGDFCIFYFYEKHWWLKIFDKNLDVVYERNLSFLEPIIDAFFIKIDPYSNRISFKKSDPEEMIVLPLDLLMTMR